MTEINVLDHGFVRLVDVMGDDSSIVQAARVSYGAGTKTVREDVMLIDYLMRNKHLSPFEMAEVKIHVKAPIFVARQWVRHRTASWNEMSARYSEMREEFYVPEPEAIRRQSATNKQAGGEPLNLARAQAVAIAIQGAGTHAFWVYKDLLDKGVARELARMVLPVNLYTEWYWKVNLRNLLHFLELRLDPHAQEEIQEYARAILRLVEEGGRFPATLHAWEEWR